MLFRSPGPVGDDVPVGEGEPEGAATAAGLGVGPALLESAADSGCGADVEFRADGAVGAPGGDERRPGDEEADEQDGYGRSGDQLDVGAAGGHVLRRYRVVIAKPGLDGHDRGAKVIARALRDAGFEVVYTGLFQTPAQVAEAALQEDADAVGLSVLSGAHMTLIPAAIAALRERELEDVLVFAGGIIPDADRDELAAAGVARVFTPGSGLDDIASWLEEALDRREGQRNA